MVRVSGSGMAWGEGVGVEDVGGVNASGAVVELEGVVPDEPDVEVDVDDARGVVLLDVGVAGVSCSASGVELAGFWFISFLRV